MFTVAQILGRVSCFLPYYGSHGGSKTLLIVTGQEVWPSCPVLLVLPVSLYMTCAMKLPMVSAA